MLFFLSVFPDLLWLTTILLPYCKGQTGSNGKPKMFFASLLSDILSFCPFVLVGAISQLCLFICTYQPQVWSVSLVLCSLYSLFMAPVLYCIWQGISYIVSNGVLNSEKVFDVVSSSARIITFLGSCLLFQLMFYQGAFLLKEPCIHNSLKLTGVYIVVFSFNSHSWV